MRCSHRAAQPLRRGVVAPAGATRRLWAANCRPCRADTAQKRRNGAGPRPPIRGATRPRWAHSAHTLSGVRACSGAARPSLPLRGPLRFLRTPRPLLRRLRLRASAPARPARPPLRGPGPALAPSLRCAPVAGAGPRAAAPRLSRSALVRRCAAPRALAGPAALGVGFASLRPPCSVGLASSLPPRCASRGPAGASPARPLRGFGPGGLRPGGLRGPSGRLFWPPAPGAFVLAAPARLRYHLRRGLSRSSERPLRGRS